MFNRDFGSRIKHFLFEPINDRTAAAIKIYLMEAIERWEPRIYVNMRDTYVIPDYDQHTYYVRIIYIIKSTQQVGEFVRSLATQVGR